jgi:hypothetical protein
MCCPTQTSIQMIEQLVSMGKTTPKYEIMTLPGMGHLVDLPNSPPTIITNHALFPRNMVAMGGSDTILHSVGQIETWNKLLDFFNNALGK